jgi:hypothetical protein
MTSITDSSHVLKILRPIIQTNARTLSRFIPAKAYAFDVEVRTQTLSSHWRIGRIFEAVWNSVGVGIRFGSTQSQSETRYPWEAMGDLAPLPRGGILNRMSCRRDSSVGPHMLISGILSEPLCDTARSGGLIECKLQSLHSTPEPGHLCHHTGWVLSFLKELSNAGSRMLSRLHR